MLRFDVVVLNYERLELFFRNFGRIENFDPERDRITVVSCSPSPREDDQVARFERENGFRIRYLMRENRGIDQLARAQYFTGMVGSLEENTSHEFVFQFQDHYFDTEHPASRWGPELGHRPKGDVVPDGAMFDFDRMERLAEEHDLNGFFCDRNNPCYVELDGRRYVSPCGGNFAIRSRDILRPEAQDGIRRMIASCDDSYTWALYAEYMWGAVFFPEGRRFYDLKRDRVFSSWSRDEFYVGPEDYAALKRRYEAPAVQRALLRGVDRAKRALVRATAS